MNIISSFFLRKFFDLLFCFEELILAGRYEVLCSSDMCGEGVDIDIIVFHFANDGLQLLHGLGEFQSIFHSLAIIK